jgi:bifunctional NMN adenylyltransferase/nudix hydrolase
MKPSGAEEFAVVIGRFQPPHRGHVYLLKEARKVANKVIIVIGSANQARDTRNPWSFEERAQMIAIALGFNNTVDMEWAGYVVTHSPDMPYNEQAWVRRIQLCVGGIVALYSMNPSKVKIKLMGLHKDLSSYYLDLFPAWEMVEVPQEEKIDATAVREAFFQHIQSGQTRGFTSSACPPEINNWLMVAEKKPEMKLMAQEWAYVQEYKKKWSVAPYPPIFVTADACIVQGGHILLIRRKDAPGKGLLAMPGGHLDPEETIQAGMIRELVEETQIKVPAKVLIGNIKKQKVFDYPARSQRGRVITHAFLIELPGTGQGLPPVKPADDAAEAEWYPLAAIKPDELFEDHNHIIWDLLGING